MGGGLRRPPPSHRWATEWRRRASDEVRLIGPRRVVSAAAALVATAVVVWWLLRPAPTPVEARLPFAAPVTTPVGVAATVGGTAPPATVVVHVVGEVTQPGLVQLVSGARVADAVEAAGGATDTAQVHAVNLAAPVRDGQRIHIPHRDDADVSALPVGDASGGDAPGVDAGVNLNLADVDQLTRLPGVGPTIAAAIVAHRERHGPFASVDALLDVPGIGPSKMEALRDLATL